MTVKVAVVEVLLNVAVITAEDEEVTEREVTVNVADVAVDGTVTLTGTCAAEGLPLDNVTTVPAAGGNPLRVTVPIILAAPPTTLVGFNVKDFTAVAAGFTVSVACAEPLSIAVTTVDVEEATT